MAPVVATSPFRFMVPRLEMPASPAPEVVVPVPMVALPSTVVVAPVIPWKRQRHEPVKLPARWTKHRYDDQASLKHRRFVRE